MRTGRWRRRARVAAALVVVTVGVSVQRMPPAAACSCRRIGDTRIEALVERVDGAFVGTVVDIDRPNAIREFFAYNADAAFRFEVESVASGRIGREVVVHAGVDSSSCGLGLEVGTRTGLLVGRDGGRWSAGLCDAVTPDELASIGRPPDPSLPIPSDPIIGPAVTVGLIVVGAVAVVALGSRARTRNDPAPS